MASGRRNPSPSLALQGGSDLATLFAAHEARLLGSLRRIYGPDVAEDLLQDTYLRLLRQKAPVEIRKPKAFLLQVARNLFFAGYRRNLRRAEVDGFNLVGRTRADESSQLETVVLKQIIIGMPQKLRDVFVLSRFGGMTNDAIAEHLGIRPKTVEDRMTKALAYCAAQLRD